MDFVNRALPEVLKILLVLVAVFIFIRIVPLLVVVGAALFAFIKIKKYFKGRKNTESKMENTSNIVDHKENPFDFSNKKVVDVEYDEIKRKTY